MNSEPQNCKSFEDPNYTECKLHSYMNKLDTRIDKAKRDLDEIIAKRARIRSIDEELFGINGQLAMNCQLIRRYWEHIDNVHEMNNKYTRQTRRLTREKTALLSFVNTSVNDEEQTTAAAAAAPSRANLQTVYESKSECAVCMTEHEGKDIVYLNNCTHTFCKFCVTRSKPQHQCMECRQPVTNFYSIEKCGERYKLKNYQMYYNFIEDRPMRPAEYMKRVRTRIVQNTSNVYTGPTADRHAPTVSRLPHLAEPSIEVSDDTD